MKTKIIVVILILSLIWPFQARAIFGALDVVTDIAHTIVSTAGWIADKLGKLYEHVLKGILTTLKKRLIEELQDAIVTWIKDESNPKFSKHIFDDVFKNAIDIAIGDILIDVADGALCSHIPAPRIQLQLEQPVYRQKIQCTFNQVVSNVAGFYNDFGAAGWIGLAEITKPQNNRYGVEILTYDELSKKTSEQAKSKEIELTGSSGFLSTKKVTEWSLVNTATGQLVTSTEIFISAGTNIISNPMAPRDGEGEEDPNHPPSYPDIQIVYNDITYKWQPTKTEITTPGKTIGAGLEKSLGADFDFILSAEEISDFIAIIADAAINRLIKERVKGLASMTLSKQPITPEEIAALQIHASTTAAEAAYDAASIAFVSNTISGILGQVNSALANLDSASSTIGQANVENNSLIVLLNGLISCLELISLPSASSTEALAWANNASSTANQRISQINNTSNSIAAALAPWDDPDNGIRTRLENPELNEVVDVSQSLLSQAQTQGNTLRQTAESLLNSIQQDDSQADIYNSQFNCAGP